MAKAKKKVAKRGARAAQPKSSTTSTSRKTAKHAKPSKPAKAKKPAKAAKRASKPASTLPSQPAKAVATVVKAVKAAVKAVKLAAKIVNSTPKAAKPAPKSKAAAKPASAAKKPARETAAQSPLKGMPVDAWIDSKVTGWQATTVRGLAALVGEVAPDSKASIKWGQLVFESNGPFAYIKPAKTHVTFGFWRGVEIGDERGLLRGEGDRMMHIKVAPGPLDTDVLTGFVREAVSLNLTKGDPTKRAPVKS